MNLSKTAEIVSNIFTTEAIETLSRTYYRMKGTRKILACKSQHNNLGELRTDTSTTYISAFYPSEYNLYNEWYWSSKCVWTSYRKIDSQVLRDGKEINLFLHVETTIMECWDFSSLQIDDTFIEVASICWNIILWVFLRIFNELFLRKTRMTYYFHLFWSLWI